MEHRRIYRREFDERVHLWRLDNGLTAVLVRRPAYAHSAALIVFRFGAVDLRVALDGRRFSMPAGTAHMLEHLSFERDEGCLFDAFSPLGANANAYTSSTTTGYHFTCTRNFRRALALLLKAVRVFAAPVETLRRERVVVTRELELSRQDPDWLLHKGLMEALYVRHPARLDIAGTPESVRKIRRSTLARAHEAFYRPDNAILAAVGGVPPRKFIETVIEAAGDWKASGPRPRRIVSREPRKVGKRRVGLRAPRMARHKFAVAFKDSPPRGGEAFVRHVLAAELACAAALGPSTDDYLRLYRRRLVDETFGIHYSAEPTFGHAILGGDSDDPSRSARAVVDAVRRKLRDGFDTDTFERMRRRVLGALLLRLNSLESTASMLADGLLVDHFYLDTPRMIETLTPGFVLSVARSFIREDRMSICTVSPAGE